MARPTKSANIHSGHLTNDQKRQRAKSEAALKGDDDKIIPPSYLSESQCVIFNYIVQELKASGILGNLDIFILAQCSIAIDRLQEIEGMINENIDQLSNSNLMASKDKYSKDLYRCTNELSLSPQARAKLGNINLQSQKEQTDPLLQILKSNKVG